MDYVGVAGAFNDPAGRTDMCTGDMSSSSKYCRNGMLGIGVARGISQCTDGTTQTILLAEQSGQVNNKEISANQLGGWHGSVNLNSLTDNSDGFQTLTGGAYGAGITTVRHCPNDYWRSGATNGAESQYSYNTVLNSFHPGGINVVFVDGSVRLLSDQIDFLTLRQLCCRDDGMLVGSGW